MPISVTFIYGINNVAYTLAYYSALYITCLSVSHLFMALIMSHIHWHITVPYISHAYQCHIFMALMSHIHWHITVLYISHAYQCHIFMALTLRQQDWNIYICIVHYILHVHSIIVYMFKIVFGRKIKQFFH